MRTSISYLLLLVLVLAVSTIVLLDGQIPFSVVLTQEQRDQDESLKKIKSTFPVVEYSADKIAGPIRDKKSRKYDKIHVLDPDKLADSEEFASTHWEAGISALPVDKSQLIVAGKVTDASAYLSENKASVYSEFKIEIEEVFKTDSLQEWKKGQHLIAEREGGRVRFATGFETWFHIAGQGMPIKNGRYLFFLSHTFPNLGYHKDDFHIITAYDLDSDHVISIDRPGGGSHPIAKTYRGKHSSVLFADLKRLLKKEPKEQGGE